MLYHLFKVLVQISIRAYFKKINVIGKQHLETKGAVFVSNHPGAMLDPMLIALHGNRSFHFIAGAEWFGKGVKRWVFENQLNMIPVYRPWLGKKNASESNEDMFRACYEKLAEGAGIMIFPEASSETVPWIRKLKTGAARIKIGGDRFMEGRGEVKVVPIGINYVNPHRFQTSATIVVGEPIDFRDLMEEGLNDIDLATSMTERIKEAMQNCVLHMESAGHYPVVKHVIKLMEEPVKAMQKHKASDAEASFRARKEIIAAVEYFLAQKDKRIDKVTADMVEYIKRYESYGFRRFNPFDVRPYETLGLLAKVVVFLPVFIVGLVLNIIPFLLSSALFRTLVLEKVKEEREDVGFNPAFAGSLAYVVALAIYVIWYTALSLLSASMYTAWVAVPLVILVGYFNGQISLIYLGWMKKLRDLLVWLRIPEDQRNELLRLRGELFKQFELFKQQFLTHRETT